MSDRSHIGRWRDVSVVTLVVIALVTLTTLELACFGYFNYSAESKTRWRLLRTRARSDADQLAAALALPVWNFDRPQIERVVESVMQDEVVAGVVLQELDGHRTKTTWGRSDGMIRKLPNEFSDAEFLKEARTVWSSTDTPLAEVRLFATTRFLEEDLRQSLRMTVGRIVAVELVLTVGLYWMLRCWVFSPLRKLEAFARAVNSGAAAESVVASKPFQGELESLRCSLQKAFSELELRLKARARAEESALHSREQLRALMGRLQRLREEERTGLSREIHDHLGQLLTALKLELRAVERRVSAVQDMEAKRIVSGKLSSAQQLADETLQSVQKIASELRPGILDRLGLAAAIEAEAKAFQARTGVRCDAKVEKEPDRLPQEIATAVFRIFQELLTNVARHAKASRAMVQLRFDDEAVNLEVEDDGAGLRGSDVDNPKSLGILGIQERAALLGGKSEFEGAPGRGTTVMVTIPYSSNGHETGSDSR